VYDFNDELTYLPFLALNLVNLLLYTSLCWNLPASRHVLVKWPAGQKQFDLAGKRTMTFKFRRCVLQEISINGKRNFCLLCFSRNTWSENYWVGHCDGNGKTLF